MTEKFTFKRVSGRYRFYTPGKEAVKTHFDHILYCPKESVAQILVDDLNDMLERSGYADLRESFVYCVLSTFHEMERQRVEWNMDDKGQMLSFGGGGVQVESSPLDNFTKYQHFALDLLYQYLSGYRWNTIDWLAGELSTKDFLEAMSWSIHATTAEKERVPRSPKRKNNGWRFTE